MRASSVLFAVLGSAAIAVAIFVSTWVLYVQRPARGARWEALRAAIWRDRSQQYLAALCVPCGFSCALAIWLVRLGVPDDLGSLILPAISGLQLAILLWMWRSDRRAEVRSRRESGGS